MFNPFKSIARAFHGRKPQDSGNKKAQNNMQAMTRARSQAVSLSPTEAVRQASSLKYTPSTSELASAKRNLKTPEQHQQRFIVSPHNDVRNLFNNSVGMGAWAKENNRPAVRPVFKDEQQRANFNQHVSNNIKQQQNAKLDQNGQNRLSTMKQLHTWSSKDNAMMDLSNSKNSRGQHPVVYVQGHGQAGDQHIYSDSHEKVSATSVANMLSNMNLPKAAEIRANSCFSGTEVNVGKTQKQSAIKSGVRNNTADVTLAGSWSKTFAGALESNLHADNNSANRHNRVVGYIGPTGQGAYGNIRKVGPMSTEQRHQKGMFATSGRGGKHELFYKRSDMKRIPGIRKSQGQ